MNNKKTVITAVAAAISLAISTHAIATTCDNAGSPSPDTGNTVDISQPIYATSSSNAWVYTDKYEYFPDMAAKAFDNIASSSQHWAENTYWRPKNQENEWLAQTFPQPKRISGYTVKPAHQNMAPEHWQFQASVNGTDWVTLDEQQGVEFTASRDKITFAITAEKIADYTHYRFYFPSNSKAIGVSEIELFEAEACEPTSPVTDISSIATYEFERPWYEQSRQGSHSWYIGMDYALTYNGQLKLYDQLEGAVVTGDQSVKILQMDSGLPDYPGISGGLASNGYWHSNTVSNILYGCLEEDDWNSYRFVQGCQINADKYAVSSNQFRSRNIEYQNQPLEQFANDIFNSNTPDIMAMAVANPTSIARKSYVHGVRVGDFIFDSLDILAISAQPGSYTDTNATIGGNYYNAIVVGKPSAGTNYSTVAEIDSDAGERFKPDIVTTTNKGSSASSWAVPSVASFASKMLSVAVHNPHLADIKHPEAAKAIIMAGAHKQGLTKQADPSIEDSPLVPYVWNNIPSKPLDRVFGAGQFDQGNSYLIFDAGKQQAEAANQKETGWDTTEIRGNSSETSYHFTLAENIPEFSTILTWNRKLTVENVKYTSYMADLSLALYRIDAQGEQLVATSDDTANNVEHIFINSGLEAGNYQLRVTLKDDVGLEKIRYGLAWQSRDNWKADSIW
jgi:F5/8 type C domain